LVILQEPIKADLGLSDAQLGLLSGFSFALVYVTAGIPIAWLADRGNRRNIVAVSLGFWSFMTALSGLAQNYGQLLAARIGVGIGEAGGSPPSHSMVSDYFPAKQRGTALSFYSTGIYIGILIGFAAGGWIAETFRLASRFFSRRRAGYFLRPALGLDREGAKARAVGSGRGPREINLQSNPRQPQRTADLLVDFGRLRVHRVYFLRQWQLHALVPHAKPRYDTRRGGGGTGLDLWDLRRSGYVYGRVFSR
jgi:MFS family permease